MVHAGYTLADAAVRCTWGFVLVVLFMALVGLGVKGVVIT